MFPSVDHVVKAPQIAIFSVAFLPLVSVVQGLAPGKKRRLAKVDQPNASPPAGVMHE